MDWTKTTARRDEKYLSFRMVCDLYYKIGGSKDDVVETSMNNAGGL